MVHGNDWGNNFLLLGFIILLFIIGMALTLISFIVHRNAHPTAAAVLATAGYVCKLPVYVMGTVSFPDIVYRGETVLCVTLAVIIIAATGYMIHMIMSAVKNNNKNNSEEQNG